VPLFGRGKSSRPPCDGSRRPGLAAEPPGWDGDPRGEPGIHGIARARRWDAVVTASAPGLAGDTVDFVALADGEVVVDGDAPGEAVRPLADAIGAMIDPPFRAEARRREETTWAVGASSIVVLEAGGLEGREVELVVTLEGRALRIDGRPTFEPTPAFERAGEAEGPEYVVRANRLVGDLWEVEATAL
jgi:hypothetical protein